jgi:hypothetical protein
LGEDVEELCWWKGVEGTRDCIGAVETGWEIDAEGERWD